MVGEESLEQETDAMLDVIYEVKVVVKLTTI